MNDADVVGGRWALAALSGRVIRQPVYVAGEIKNAWQSVDTKRKAKAEPKMQHGGDTRADSLYPFVRSSPLAVVVLGMAAIGQVPVSFHRCYKPLLSVCRSSLVYDVLLYCIFCVSYVCLLKDQLMTVLDPETKLDALLFCLESILALLPSIVNPWVWACATNFRKMMWNFAEYEESFLSVTNRSLRDRWTNGVRNLRLHVTMLFLFGGVGCIAGPYFAITERTKAIFSTYNVTSDDPYGNTYYYVPAAFLSLVSSSLFFLFTIAYFLQLRETAIALSEHIDQLRPGDTAGVRRAQKLWVSLRALFNDRPSFYLLDVFFMSQLFAMLLLSVSLWYDLSSAKMLVSASTQVIWMFVLSFQAYRMSDLAHGAVSAMHGPVTAALDRLSMDARDEHFHRAFPAGSLVAKRFREHRPTSLHFHRLPNCHVSHHPHAVSHGCVSTVKLGQTGNRQHKEGYRHGILRKPHCGYC
ncbi:uncharacterized protein LOC113216783 isoform X1 [Frankliniella occidentalis]|uniref:Uncharacterized protein LOC113216783 isoform X1 n=1 Tax=Frankliniella occidentalis TaxID=133901 RepID=A0A9C6WNV6_FRAOC|nr:uncharacterized protein LOC113216783 isoform X1 [Frankliniella occidentalis]